MRLVPVSDNVQEVHEDNRMIGKTWRYDGKWRAELKNGTAVGHEFDSAKEAGNAVAAEHRGR